jgi:hypothetical protein
MKKKKKKNWGETRQPGRRGRRDRAGVRCVSDKPEPNRDQGWRKTSQETQEPENFKNARNKKTRAPALPLPCCLLFAGAAVHNVHNVKLEAS